MVSNPMQKKARNSFLLGMIITLIICILIAVLVYLLVIAPQGSKSDERGEEVIAYVLNQDVKSGQEVTSSMFKQITVYSSMLPNNYLDGAKLQSLNLQDENGNAVPVVAKVDIPQNTVLTTALISRSDQLTTDATRYAEYNMLILPTTLAVGDFIDIRITFPNGQDFIVVSKKEVKSILGNTIGIELSEQEILMLESAIVEAYIMSSTKMYVIQYVEPGNQAAAAETYTPTSEVVSLINNNPNIEQEAREALANRFSNDRRSEIDSEKSYYSVEKNENLEEGIKEEIENAQAAREAYLSGLTSY